jgi:hypothetical protein
LDRSRNSFALLEQAAMVQIYALLAGNEADHSLLD